jgi:hypothetical protein
MLNASSALQDAALDRICRKTADPANDSVLIALGDSVTSAHWQKKNSGSKDCTQNNTVADDRGMPGNDMTYSYAGRYFDQYTDISEYYNFARTGFTTRDMVNAGQNDKDGCANEWARSDTPLGLATAVTKEAKKNKKKVYAVMTGGINNTNWVKIIDKMFECRRLAAAVEAAKVLPWPMGLSSKTKFRYRMKLKEGEAGFGNPANLIEREGYCQAEIWDRSLLGPVFRDTIDITIPAYDGPGSAAPGVNAKAIAADAANITRTLLTAGADEVVWMLYYDISPAQIDLGQFFKDGANDWVTRRLVSMLGLDSLGTVSLINPVAIGNVKKYVKLLNEYVESKLPPAVIVVDPLSQAVKLTFADMQDTAIGGSPHPNDRGHKKLRDYLSAALN